MLEAGLLEAEWGRVARIGNSLVPFPPTMEQSSRSASTAQGPYHGDAHVFRRFYIIWKRLVDIKIQRNTKKSQREGSELCER